MGIVNRRNAVVGWMVWTVGKRVMERKARAVVSTGASGARLPKKALVAVAAAGAAAVAYVFLRRGGGDDTFGP